MKSIFCVLIIILFTNLTFPQFDVRAGMGIDFSSSPSLTDYINQNFAGSNQLGSFSSAVVFSGEGDYYLNENFQVGVEVAYLLNSYTYTLFDGRKYELKYNIIMPSAMGYYVIQGSGYNFKFGGGIGPRFVSAEESISIESSNYSSIGFGAVIKVDGNTAISNNVYANIGGDIRYNLNGEPKNGDKYLVNTAVNEKVNFNSFSVGVRLGITIIF